MLLVYGISEMTANSSAKTERKKLVFRCWRMNNVLSFDTNFLLEAGKIAEKNVEFNVTVRDFFVIWRKSCITS